MWPRVITPPPTTPPPQSPGQALGPTSAEALDTSLRDVTFVVVDVETTGGSKVTSLTEVAAARYRGGEVVGTYQTLVRPDQRIPPLIAALTGISDAMVRDAPPDRRDPPLVFGVRRPRRHRGPQPSLRPLVSQPRPCRHGTGPLPNATVDTLTLARRLVRDQVPNCKLATLAANLELPHRPSTGLSPTCWPLAIFSTPCSSGPVRSGSWSLGELLDLPLLIGHPQAAKLRLTARLPRSPGVYWLTNAVGQALYVGKATDLQARVRSYFTGDRRSKVGRLLRQLHAVNHRVCPGPLSAAVTEGRLIRAWSPDFNKQGKAKKKEPAEARTTIGPRLPGDLLIAGMAADPPGAPSSWHRIPSSF